MREGALPSPVNQARVMHEVLAHARRENFRVNLIEAYDQPWKRQLEGTVGGHWGIYNAYRRQPKFAWGGAVSNHPHWRWQAAGRSNGHRLPADEYPAPVLRVGEESSPPQDKRKPRPTLQ